MSNNSNFCCKSQEYKSNILVGKSEMVQTSEMGREV